MRTARNDPVDLLFGALREIVLTVLGWIGALTALYVIFRATLPSFENSIRRAGGAGSVGDFLPGGDGSVLAGWIDWLGAYTGGDPGQSIQFARPVGEVVGEASALSVTLLFVMVVVTALLVAVGFAIATRLGNHARRLLVVPAYALCLVLPLVGLLFVLWLSYGPQVLPTALASSPDSSGTIQVGLAVVVSVVLALPVVGDVIRRVHRAGAGTRGRIDARTLLDRGPRGLGTVELWTYLLYLASALVVVEQIFQYPGLGYMLVEAVNTQDYPLLFGVAARIVAIVAVLALVRNLGWVVVRFASGGGRAASGSHPARGPDTNQARHRADGGRSGTDGRAGASVGHRPGVEPSQGGTPPAGPGGPSGDGSPTPTSGTLWRAFARRTKTKAAAGLFAVAALLALVGLATGPVDPQSFARPPIPGITPTLLAQTTASILLGTIVALLLATVLGVLPGLLAGVADARGGRVSSVVAAALRVPSEAALLVPLSVAGVLWVITFPPAPTSVSVELAIGTIAGVVLAGFAFRAVYEAARDVAITGRPTGEWITEALMAGGARLDFVTATTAFVATEIVFLGMVPRSDDVYAGIVQLGITFRRGLFTTGDLQLAVLLLPILGAAPVLLALYLLGDGLGEALRSVRSGGGGASGAPPSGAPAPESTRGTGGQERAAAPRGGSSTPPGQGGEGSHGPQSGGSETAAGTEGEHPPGDR